MIGCSLRQFVLYYILYIFLVCFIIYIDIYISLYIYIYIYIIICVIIYIVLYILLLASCSPCFRENYRNKSSRTHVLMIRQMVHGLEQRYLR